MEPTLYLEGTLLYLELSLNLELEGVFHCVPVSTSIFSNGSKFSIYVILCYTLPHIFTESEESNFYSSISGSDVSGSESEGIDI